MTPFERLRDTRYIPETRRDIAQIIHDPEGKILVESGLRQYMDYVEEHKTHIPLDYSFSITSKPSRIGTPYRKFERYPRFQVESLYGEKNAHQFYFSRPHRKSSLNPVESALLKTDLYMRERYSQFIPKHNDAFSALEQQHPIYFETIQTKSLTNLLRETQNSYFDSVWQLMMNCDSTETQLALVRNFLKKPNKPHPTAPQRLARLSPAEQCAAFSSGFWGELTSFLILLDLPNKISQNQDSTIHIPGEFFVKLKSYNPQMYHGGCPFIGSDIIADFYNQTILPVFEKYYESDGKSELT